MAYKIMKQLIENYKNGKTANTKDMLSEKCDVYFGAGKLRDDQYMELTGLIAALDTE